MLITFHTITLKFILKYLRKEISIHSCYLCLKDRIKLSLIPEKYHVDATLPANSTNTLHSRLQNRSHRFDWFSFHGTFLTFHLKKCYLWYKTIDNLVTISCVLKRPKQVYRRRYDKPPVAARCCHAANDLTNFTGNRRTNKQTDSIIAQSRRIWERELNPFIATLKAQSNGPSYSNTVIGTLTVDGWVVTSGTARRGLGGLGPRPSPPR